MLDEYGKLWLAKFPGAIDAKDMGAWEMVVHDLAIESGIEMPEAKLVKFSGKHHTFLSKRFDRNPSGKPVTNYFETSPIKRGLFQKTFGTNGFYFVN